MPVNIDKLTKRQKDWIGCFGNTWSPRKVLPGTCERCVWGHGEHSADCTVDSAYYLVNPVTREKTEISALDVANLIVDGNYQNVALGRINRKEAV